MRQADRVDRLHEEIDICDTALRSMEDLLQEFKASLGQLSETICYLQTKSQDISIKLDNRKQLEKLLGQFTQQITIGTDFIRTLSSGEINVPYCRLLSDLHSKLEFNVRKEIKNTAAAKEIRPKLQQLKAAATENIRKWVLLRIDELKGKNANLMTSQNAMIRCRYILQFLKLHSPNVEGALRENYNDIVSKLYFEQYKKMTKMIPKQFSQICTAMETIVPTIHKSFFKSKHQTGESNPFFSLGERATLLNHILDPPHDFGDGSYPLEMLMRSLYQRLIDALTAEFVFTSEFFIDRYCYTEQ
jgi:hypothetical protein